MSTPQKVVLVTGCSQGGIGFALCNEYASRGCKVYATARRLEAMKGFKHPNIQQLRLDVTDDHSIAVAVDEIITRESRIDLLVNNAGMTCSGPTIEVDLERIQRTFDTNVYGIIRVSRAVIPHMAARKSGVIVNVGSITGEVPLPFAGIYSASKAAVHSLTESLYMECMPLHISVVFVSSGGANSTIVKNMKENFSVPPTELYTDYVDVIAEQFEPSRAEAGMPLERYAPEFVGKTLKKSPLRYFTVGAGSTLVAMLRLLLPRGVLLRLLWSQLVEKSRTRLAKIK